MFPSPHFYFERETMYIWDEDDVARLYDEWERSGRKLARLRRLQKCIHGVLNKEDFRLEEHGDLG